MINFIPIAIFRQFSLPLSSEIISKILEKDSVHEEIDKILSVQR